VLQAFAAFSIFSGGGYGRWVGILSASLGAIGALLSIPGYPFGHCACSWSTSSSSTGSPPTVVSATPTVPPPAPKCKKRPGGPPVSSVPWLA
jgi:hypothetical protein